MARGSYRNGKSAVRNAINNRNARRGASRRTNIVRAIRGGRGGGGAKNG